MGFWEGFEKQAQGSKLKAETLEDLDKDPIWKASIMPEDHDRDFRHSAESHFELMEDAAKRQGMSRQAAAKKFTSIFSQWFKKNRSSYVPADHGRWLVHKKDKTPMAEDFQDHAMRRMPGVIFGGRSSNAPKKRF